MILRPKTQLEFVDQLRALPAERRRVVVLFGRHPNEGSINIAVRYHEQWEQHGGVSVWIPPAWTPPGYWRLVEKTPHRQRIRKARELSQEIPPDKHLVKLLERNGVSAPVVNLHGTARQKSGLFISPHYNAPTWVKKAVAETLDNSPEDVMHLSSTPAHTTTDHPLEVTVEYDYFGREERKHKFRKEADKIGTEHGQLVPRYLTRPGLYRGELIGFSARYAVKLNELITKLAKASAESENQGRT